MASRQATKPVGLCDPAEGTGRTGGARHARAVESARPIWDKAGSGLHQAAGPGRRVARPGGGVGGGHGQRRLSRARGGRQVGPLRRRQVPGDVPALDRGPGRLLGRAGAAARLDQGRRPGSRTSTSRTTPASAGSRTACSTSAPTASTAIWRAAASRPRSSGRATIRRVDRKITYRELHEQVCRLANVLKGLGVKKGDRVTIYMPMIPETAYRDARLRADRRDPLGGVRRLLARQPGRPDQRLRQQARDHDRRRQARRPQHPAQGQYRRGAEALRGRRPGADVPATPAPTSRSTEAATTTPMR